MLPTYSFSHYAISILFILLNIEATTPIFSLGGVSLLRYTASRITKTGELDAAKNEIDSVRKFHLLQSKHLTSQYIVAVHSVQNEKTAHVERGPP
jgi:hypothetical protein